MSIRRATGADVGSLVFLRGLLDQQAERSGRPIWTQGTEYTDRLVALFEDYLRERSVAVFVAEEDEQVVGYAAGRVDVRHSDRRRVVGLILHAFALKEWRDRGVATALVKSLLAFFEARDVEEIHVRYTVGHRDVERFWRRLGFQPLLCTATTSPAALRGRLEGEKP